MRPFLLAVVLLSAIATPALAQTQQPAKFYDMETVIIEGQPKVPANLVIERRVRAKFAVILRLKKSFLPQITVSQKDPSLR